MKVLVACEFSGIVRDAFRKLGHDAWSCDLLDCESDSTWHIKYDVLKYLNDGWDLMIAHPPCTYLTNAGVRHLHENVSSKTGKKAKVHGEARMQAMRESAIFFNELKDAPINRIAIENPIPHKYAREIIGQYSQIIQPYWFGHPESKRTCLWLKNLPKLCSTKYVKDQMLLLPKKLSNRVHYASPSPDRWKEWSRTYKGIADAMASQWSNLKV